jgi:hypothetical protein
MNITTFYAQTHRPVAFQCREKDQTEPVYQPWIQVVSATLRVKKGGKLR